MLNIMRIGVGFKPKLQFTFCYTAVSVKLGFMAVSFSLAPSQRLVTKSRLCYNTNTLLQ
jgi:hypothetical protein